MGRPARRITISDEDDVQLRELELGVHIHPKVRLRASVLRLHRTGWTVAQLAEHVDRTIQAVHNDLTRFEERGLAGLADGCAPGQTPLVTTEIEQFLHEKLLEPRFWNAPLLCEAVAERFHVTVGTRALTNHLHRLGYRWKRARYSPTKTLDPEIIHEHTASIETLKRGHWTAD
jgi:transposase